MKLSHLRQFKITRFIKFCIIGMSSFIVGFLVFNLSYILTKQLIFSLTLAYVLSVANGFIWNRQWTFKDRREKPLWDQAIRFFCFYVLGYAINLLFYTLFLSLIVLIHDQIFHLAHFSRIVMTILHGQAKEYSLWIVNTAGLLATGIMIIWNYLTSHLAIR